MKKSQEEKDLLQQIVQLHEVTSIKKSMIILLVLWVVAGVFLLFFVVPLGIIFLILTPLLILLYYLAYRGKVRYFLTHPDMIGKEQILAQTDITQSETGITQNQDEPSQTKHSSAAQVVIDATASYAIGRAVSELHKQSPSTKYGVRASGCDIISQEKNRVTYQLRCSKCGAVVGMAKTCFLNPSQKKVETTKCPICKQYFSTALQLVRG